MGKVGGTRRMSAQGERRAVTIREVARRAGVSTATVSRTLASPERVAPETRESVFVAVRETGYTPNAAARNLRARSSKIVLVLVPGMSNTFFTPILNAIEDTLWEDGYGMIIGDTGHSAAKEAHYVRLIRSGQVDGVILFTGRLPRDEGPVLSPDRIPITLVCNEIPGEEAISVFDVDNRGATHAAVNYLVACGHRRIAHIVGPPDNVEAMVRLAAYREALAAAGIAVEEGLVWGRSFRFEGGVAAAHSYLGLRDRPSAVFSGADDAAIGFIKTVREAGIRVPDDVSIIGFDDIDLAEVIDPPLTTMRQPRPALGRAAAADLIKRMKRGARDLPPTRLRLNCDLVIRGSVRTLPAARTKAATRRRRPSPPRAVRPATGREAEVT